MTPIVWVATSLLAVALIAGTLSDTVSPRAPLMAGGYRMVAADFHVHTFPLSASTIAPWDVPAEARRQGLDAVAVTGHNETISGKAARWWQHMAGGATVIAGEEIHGPRFHLIAAGIHSTISWRLSASDAIDEVHRQGGIAIAAHPTVGMWPAYRDVMAKLDGSEVAHPLMFGHEEFRRAFEEFFVRGKASPIGSSDFHGPGPIGVCRTYVFARDDSEQAILDAIRAHRTVVMDGGRAYGDPVWIALARSAGLPKAPVEDGWLARLSRVCGVLGLVAGVWAFGANRPQSS